MTKFQLHVQEWKGCTLCPLSQGRTRVVLSRGKVPCDVLFVGEAPGRSEDVVGQPFVGPAGQLFDKIVERAVRGMTSCPVCRNLQMDCPSGVTCSEGHGFEERADPVRLGFTNLIACIPLDEEGEKVSQPDEDHVKACSPRLQQFIEITNPRLIVRVGQVATDFLTQGFSYSVKVPKTVRRMVDVSHPAAILRAPTAQQSLMRQRCVIAIGNAIRVTFKGEDS